MNPTNVIKECLVNNFSNPSIRDLNVENRGQLVYVTVLMRVDTSFKQRTEIIKQTNETVSFSLLNTCLSQNGYNPDDYLISLSYSY